MDKTIVSFDPGNVSMSEDCCSRPSAGSAVFELPSRTVRKKSQVDKVCPECKQQGKAVRGQTVKALLSASLRSVEDTDYYFCRTEACPVVYYSVDGKSTFLATQVRERVYQKTPDADDVLVCYCFKHTVGEIRSATPEGRAAILDDIDVGVQDEQCACDLRNPQGSCCLGNVRALIRRMDRESVRS